MPRNFAGTSSASTPIRSHSASSTSATPSRHGTSTTSRWAKCAVRPLKNGFFSRRTTESGSTSSTASRAIRLSHSSSSRIDTGTLVDRSTSRRSRNGTRASTPLPAALRSSCRQLYC